MADAHIERADDVEVRQHRVEPRRGPTDPRLPALVVPSDQPEIRVVADDRLDGAGRGNAQRAAVEMDRCRDLGLDRVIDGRGIGRRGDDQPDQRGIEDHHHQGESDGKAGDKTPFQRSWFEQIFHSAPLEHISDTPDRVDHRFGTGVGQPFPQPRYMAVQGVGLDFVIKAVHRLFKRRPHDGTSGSSDEDLQRKCLPSREVEIGAADQNLQSADIHRQIAFGDDVGGVVGSPPCRRPDPRQQLFCHEWLADIVVGALVQAFDAVLGVCRAPSA